jgi:general secretion pathway protein D
MASRRAHPVSAPEREWDLATDSPMGVVVIQHIRRSAYAAVMLAICLISASAIAAAGDAASRPTAGLATFSLNFKDTPLDTVLDYFSKTIGFEILKDGPIDARVTIMSKQPVTAEEAITMLSAALRVNDFAVTREGRFLHIGSRDKARKGNVPVHFGNNPADIPDTDELITQVVPVQNVSAEKLKDDLKPIANADMTANEGSNSIIITDSSSIVRRLVQIISQLDQHESTTSEIRIVQLKHANAAATAKLIDTLFKQQTPPAPQQNRGMPMPQQPDQQGAEAGGPQRHGATVITAADDRTNTVLILASADTLKLIDTIIDRLDADNPNPAPQTGMRIYPLRFAQADATAKLINTVFKAKESTPSPFFFLQGLSPPEEAGKEAPINAVSDDRTNTLVVTGPPTKLADVDALVQKLDASPMSSAELRVIHLKYMDAGTAAKLVEDTFQPKKTTEEDNSPFRFIFLSPVAPEEKVQGVKITATYDERTNNLLISAPHEMLDTIEKVVRDLDTDSTTEDTLFIYHLRNAQAEHLEFTLNVLFGNISNGGQNQQNNPQNPQQLQQNANPLAGGAPPANNSNSNTNSNTRNGNNRNQQNQNRHTQIGQGFLSEMTGQVLVVAEPDTNSLLVSTSTKFEKKVQDVIAELDRPVPQVLIRCLIAEVTHDNSLDLGTDFSVLDLRSGGNGESLGSTLGAAAAAASATTPPGFVARVLESNVTATLQALAQTNKLDVLSRPYILTSDNQQADITVGDEVPFVTGSFTDENGGVHNTVVYQDIGIILNVTPHINPDGLVVMDISPEISALTGQTVTIQQGVDVPVFEKRSADSRVAIRDGQTIVIGGLMQDQKTENVSKIPLLGDIPLLGKLLFSYNTVSKTKTELLVFLSPHVAMEPDMLLGQSRNEVRGLKLLPGAIEPGAAQQQLNGMSRGSTTQPSVPLQLPPAIPPNNGAPEPPMPGDSH